MSHKISEIDDDLPGDLLWGVDGKDGIAAFLNVPPRKAYYLIEQKIIPVKKHAPGSLPQGAANFAAASHPTANNEKQAAPTGRFIHVQRRNVGNGLFHRIAPTSYRDPSVVYCDIR